MKFTSLAVAALFLANTSAVQLRDDCNGKWCNKGLAYDLDEATLRKAEADNAAKTHHFNGATAAADAAAGAAKADAAAAFAGADYKDRASFKAVEAKEASLDASLKAADDHVAKTLIAARANRALAASAAAKAASDANLKATQDRVAYEKDQLVKGED